MAFVLTPGQRHEQTAFRELLEQGAVKRRGPGRPKLRPRTIMGDKGYTGRPVRDYLRRHGISALGRKNSLFAGSDGGARHWAIVASLVATAKLNGVEPLAWLTDVLERVVSGRTKAHELARLLPWTWETERLAPAVRT